MKIMFVIHSLSRGGAERVISLLANKNSEIGESIIHLTEGNSIGYKLNPLVEVEKCLIKSKFLLVRRVKSLILLRKSLRRHNPDVVISFITRTNIYTLIASIGLKIPIIISERNNPRVDPKNILIRMARKIIYNFSDALVLQSNYAKQYFSRLKKPILKIIMNPVSDYFHQNEISPILSRKNIITFVGRLEEQKNIPLLINSFKEIINSGYEYTLFIIGTGSLDSKLKKIVFENGLRNHVIFTGEIEDVKSQLQNSQIFVLPSNYEGMSNALAEAMVSGCCVIATDCPSYGNRELIINGYNGYLINVASQDQLIKRMIEIIEDDKVKITISKNATNLYDKLDIDIIINEWFSIANRVKTKDTVYD